MKVRIYSLAPRIRDEVPRTRICRDHHTEYASDRARDKRQPIHGVPPPTERNFRPRAQAGSGQPMQCTDVGNRRSQVALAQA